MTPPSPPQEFKLIDIREVWPGEAKDGVDTQASAVYGHMMEPPTRRVPLTLTSMIPLS